MLVVHPLAAGARTSRSSSTTPRRSRRASTTPPPGAGTSTHLAAEMFKTMTGANLVHVPFKGNAEVLNALLGGHVKVHFGLTASTLAARAQRRAARARGDDRKAPARAAGRADHRRARLSGLRDQLLAGRVRAGRHAEGHRRQAQRRDRRACCRRRRCSARISREGADPVGSSPEQFDERFQNEVEKWAKVAKAAGLAAAN